MVLEEALTQLTTGDLHLWTNGSQPAIQHLGTPKRERDKGVTLCQTLPLPKVRRAGPLLVWPCSRNIDSLRPKEKKPSAGKDVHTRSKVQASGGRKH